MCSNVYDNVTNFEVCGLIKNTKTQFLDNETLLFLQIKRIHS